MNTSEYVNHIHKIKMQQKKMSEIKEKNLKQSRTITHQHILLRFNVAVKPADDVAQ